MVHVTFEKMRIKYIINKIDVQRSQNYNTSPVVGGDGSTTSYISRTGRVISFTSMCLKNEIGKDKKHRIQKYIRLAEIYSRIPGVLTSPSKSDLKGRYLITNFDYTENTNGDYEIDWEFTEITKFNVTLKTFKVWNKKGSTNNKKKKTSKTNGLNSNLKNLLGKCGTMRKGSTGKCAKALQIFLQSQGFYKKYKLDGLYQRYTKEAVEGLQRKYKLKVNGEWDKTTRKYFQKKYDYPKPTPKKGKNNTAKK